MSTRRLVLLSILSFFVIASCSKPEEAPKDNRKTLVILVGGLGGSQLKELETAIESQCPDAFVVDAGGWDAYKANILSLAIANQREKLVLIGHSFGGEAVAIASHPLNPNLLVLIDPVTRDWGNLPAPGGEKFLWFRRETTFGPVRANIEGLEAIQVPGGHNDLPHDPAVMDAVVEAINGL